MGQGTEYTQVELPFIDQLVQMGWKHTTGATDHASADGRESLRDVLLVGEVRDALRRINLDPNGAPWLDDGRITQAVNALSRLGTNKLLEANMRATERIVEGTVVDGVEGWESGRGRTVHYIDWKNPGNNVFRVVSQLYLKCPTGRADKSITPDLVLFVNGIPLVVVEAKSPNTSAPIDSAIDQLQRYANRRRDLGVVNVDEGNEALFHYAQFVVATCFDDARVGTFSSLASHYLAWKDTSPVPMAEVAHALGKPGETLSPQETLVAGMLRPAHLLDIVQHFTLFKEADGQTVKIVCRYQQFRAVQKAIHRLLTGETRLEHGEQDQRGGIIWHTQGSGKSLTMVFLIRKMRSLPTLRPFKIVVVTDRRDLEKQLAETARLTGEHLTRVKARTVRGKSKSANQVLQDVLALEGQDLVFAMIQKYRGELLDPDAALDDEDEDLVDEPAEGPPPKTKPLPELNTDPSILVLVDEAHRSHTNTAHANLMRALPNCARIGFTGTPIIMGNKKKTQVIFGPDIDRYRIREAEADEAIVPILYEGRTTGAAVDGGGELDGLFEDMLAERTPAEVEAIKRKYATKGHVMEAEALIAAKARDMLRHYVADILPNGYKAMVVAVSRRATIRYYDALRAARDALVAEVEALDPALLALDQVALARLEPDKADRVRAHRYLPTLKALEFAPVISGAHNDTVDPTGAWSTRRVSEAHVERFKKPLFADGPNTFDHEKADPLAFLIVKSMLLTGFDAPVAQVLYLDRQIKEAELLQAIARVNRTHTQGGVRKGPGIVVDYYGVARHLTEALKEYAAEDIDGALQSLADEIPKLRDRHRRAVAVFAGRGIDDLDDTEACIELLRDDRIRAEFHVALKLFLETLDRVLPRPEGLPFVHDARLLAWIQARARNRYRGDALLIGQEVGAKVRALIDEHVVSMGIDPRIPPIQITSAHFAAHVDAERSPRAKASEMEHALRYHIRQHLDEDPAFYERLSERLRHILDDLQGRWGEQVAALSELIDAAVKGRQADDDDTGLDPDTQAPFFDLLVREAFGDAAPGADTRAKLVALTVELVEHVQQEIGLVNFWGRDHAKHALRSWIDDQIDRADLVPLDKLDAVVDKVMELARSNRHRLTR